MSSFGINSNNTITPSGTRNATVMIEHGVISDVIDGKATTTDLIDIGDKVLMPGIIDPHVHINEPGRTDWEGFHTATTAAAAGGITMLVDMPLNSSPVTATAEAFDQKLNATKDQLHTNCGFWAGIIQSGKQSEKEIERLIERGVLGFKAFLIHSGIDEFPNVTESDLRKAMPIIAKHKLPLLVHCELESHKPQTINNKRSYNEYLNSRPPSWEDNAITLMIHLCEEFNCRVHIVHLSAADSIERIKKAKSKGLPLSVETGQHYLYFSAEEIKDGQTQFKCAPPIRERTNRERLWDALKNDVIDFVATDHSPAPPAMKDIEGGDFFKAWGGIASLQFALPVLWTAAKNRGFLPQHVAKWLCEHPASIAGQQNKKGKIEKGFDADLVVWDPEKKFTVTEDIILHKHKITPYLGETLYGVVEQTWLAGEKVFENGKFLHLNKGKLIKNI
jgi:allantoinase